jgi:hypothetical protein
MRHRHHALAAGLAGLLLTLALPAAADITVVGRYKMFNGDTLTRSSYYSSKKMRTLLPNGDEIIYDNGSHRIALVDHGRKLFWEGPLSEADSIAARLRSERVKAMTDTMSADTRATWNTVYTELTENVKIEATGRSRKIAGYPCSAWVLTAGSYLRQERWLARSLSLPDFSPEVEKVVQASILDPLGRGLMKLVLQARSADGLALSGRMTVKTFDYQGEMSWEAVKVSSGKIPDEVWVVPEGYQRWEPPARPAGD